MELRRYDTDPEYRQGIDKSAKWNLDIAGNESHRTGTEHYGGMPVTDAASQIAHAIVSELNGRGGIELYFEDEIDAEIIDTATSIVRQGMALRSPTQEAYERTGVLDVTSPELKIYHDGQADRDDVLDKFFDQAEKWAAVPGLTVQEACHGVAGSLYGMYGPTELPDEVGETYETDPIEDYSDVYDMRFEDKIRQRKIRAAIDLFMDPPPEAA